MPAYTNPTDLSTTNFLLYCIETSNYNVVNFDEGTKKTYVCAPSLADFLKANSHKIIDSRFTRAWYNIADFLKPQPVTVNARSWLSFAQNKNTLLNLGGVATNIKPNYYDANTCYVGKIITNNGQTLIATTDGKTGETKTRPNHPLSLVFCPQTRQLIWPTDTQTENIEKITLANQYKLVYDDFKLNYHAGNDHDQFNFPAQLLATSPH